MAEREVWQKPVTDPEGSVIEGATITVLEEDGQTVATIYQSLTGAVKDNPFQTGSDGLARFYADPGRYVVRAQKGSLITENIDVDLSMKALRLDLTSPDYTDALSFSFRDLNKSQPNYTPYYTRPVFAISAGATNFTGVLIVSPVKNKQSERCTLQEWKEGSVTGDTAQNVSGNSFKRPVRNFAVYKAVCGMITPFTQSENVTSGSFFSNNVYDDCIGRPAANLVSGNGGGSSSGSRKMSARVLFNLNGAAEQAEYYANGKSSAVLFGSGTSTTAFEVHVYRDGAYTLNQTIDLSVAGKKVITFDTEGRVKFINTTGGNAYVIGVNIDSLRDARADQRYDEVFYFREKNINGNIAFYLGPGEGANELALRSRNGRFFGSFHGGHTDETVTLSDGKETLNLPLQVSTGLYYGSSITLKSVSTLTSDQVVYNCVQTTEFFEGGQKISINLKGGGAEILDRAFLGMAVCDKRFNVIASPETIKLTGLTGNIQLGDENSRVTLTDPVNGHSITTLFTSFDMRYSDWDGAYVEIRNNDNKIYYNILQNNSNIKTQDISFSMYHIFNSAQ